MDVLVIGSPRLERWDGRACYEMTPEPRDHHDVYERDLVTEPPGQPGVSYRRVADAILGYSIFPPRLVEGIVRRRIEIGDTVGVHYLGLPLIRLFFASRVIDVFDGPAPDAIETWWQTGFTYRTLVGHPELGEETFSVEKELASGRVRVALRSWSRPGTRLAKLFAPLMRRFQVGASMRALDHLASFAREGSVSVA